MILSQSEEAVGHWWSSEGDIGEPRHHRGEIVAPIEAVFEFGEVAGHMLVTDGAVGASEGALDDSEGSVYRLKGEHQCRVGLILVIGLPCGIYTKRAPGLGP